jgi:hypothetical protein
LFAIAIAIALSSAPALAGARGETALASGAVCHGLAGQLVPKTREGRRVEPSLPGVNLATTAICHDFDGDGRRDVAFAIASGGTGGAFAWAVFRRTNRAGGPPGHLYRKVAELQSGSHTGLRHRGRLIVAVNPIYRPGDANCCPTGGQLRRFYRVERGGVVLVRRAYADLPRSSCR